MYGWNYRDVIPFPDKQWPFVGSIWACSDHKKYVPTYRWLKRWKQLQLAMAPTTQQPCIYGTWQVRGRWLARTCTAGENLSNFCHIEQKLHRTRYRPSIETLNLKDVDHGHFLLFSPIQVHQQHPATIHPILAVYGFMPYHGEEQLQLLWSLWQARHLWDGRPDRGRSFKPKQHESKRF